MGHGVVIYDGRQSVFCETKVDKKEDIKDAH